MSIVWRIRNMQFDQMFLRFWFVAAYLIKGQISKEKLLVIRKRNDCQYIKISLQKIKSIS